MGLALPDQRRVQPLVAANLGDYGAPFPAHSGTGRCATPAPIHQRLRGELTAHGGKWRDGAEERHWVVSMRAGRQAHAPPRTVRSRAALA